MAHLYTVEKIYNFTCSRCKNWWSYASEEKGLPTYIQQNFACPHCGHRDSIGKPRNLGSGWKTIERNPT